ncbi:unnamed protein product [Schistosoma turkestanicum]|nr:unnamed protein product [Schistosoma turkestanicum]
MESSQKSPSEFHCFKSELIMPPPETPLHVTQEAISMLEAYLNIGSLKRQKDIKSNNVFVSRHYKPDDSTTGGSNSHSRNLNLLPLKEDIQKSEVLESNKTTICTNSIHMSRIPNLSVVDRECLEQCANESHLSYTTKHFKDACSSNSETISNKTPLLSTNRSFVQGSKINELYEHLDSVDGLGAKSQRSDSIHNSSNIESVSPSIFEISTQITSIGTGSSLSKKSVMKDDSVSSSIIRYHSVSSESTQKTHFIPKIQESEVSSHHNEYTRRLSVRSAPEDIHHCVRMKSKRNALKKWFKFRLPKRSFNFKSHIGNKLSATEGGTLESKNAFRGTYSQEKTTVLENGEYIDCEGNNSILFEPIPNINVSTDMINKSDKRLHHPLFINVCTQFFPRLFRQNDSSSNYITSGFFPRMQRLSTNTNRRVKRNKRKARKFNKVSTQASVEEQEEKFQLTPLYTKRRSSRFSHYGNDELFANKRNLLIERVDCDTLNRSNYSSNKESSDNDSFKTPIINSKTWPIGSPNSKVASEIARLYRGLIETIESDKLVEPSSQTWSHFTDRKFQILNNKDVPSNSVKQNIKNYKTENSSNTPELQNDSKVRNSNNQSTNRNTHYPYAKYIAAMIDALSERLMGKISEDDLELRFQTLEAEAFKAAKQKNVQSLKQEQFCSVSHDFENLRCPNSLQHATRGHSSSDENLFNTTETEKLENRCHSVSDFCTTKNPSDLYNTSSLELSQCSLKHSCLAQVKRLQLRNKLIITEDLLNRLINHTTYPSFEADILELLGRQPNWHRIAILYYLTRCSVRHILNSHIQRMETLQESTSNLSTTISLTVDSDSEELHENHTQSSRSKSPHQCSLYSLNSTYDTIIRDTGQCRANIGRIKDYTITFFTRWYADWVYKRGGWQSVIEETEDSEID